MQIHFLSDVLVAIASLDLKVPIIPENGLYPSLTVILSTHVQLNLCTMVTLGKWQGDCYNIIQSDLYITGELCRKYKTTENFSKLLGDRNMCDDCYIQGHYL